MDLQRAASYVSHLKLLQSKLRSLESELRDAIQNETEICRENDALEAKLKEHNEDFEQKRAEMMKTFADELDEYKKQVKFSEELLQKRTEERESLLKYLSELNICEKSHEQLLGFDWAALKEIAANGDADDLHEKQHEKALEVSVMLEKANQKMERLSGLLNSTDDARYQVTAKIRDINRYVQRWKHMAADQQRRVSNLESDNYRLSLIIKQCISTNEPMSENITRNVRDKCHSFINSSTDDELVQGLKKYHKRQDNKIKFLKHKVNKLSHEISHLQVASDQTADLIQHYLSMIQYNSERMLAFNPPRAPPMTNA